MGKFNISHITKAVQRQVDDQPDLVVEEQGTVLSVEDGIVRASGLSQSMLSEIVEFKNGERGMILNLERNQVGIVMLTPYDQIQEGDPVFRTNQIFKIPVGDQFLGRVVNANGEPIDGKGAIVPDGELPVEKIAPRVMTRQSVDQPLVTGILSIDAMFPIGRGQRELIIGDRQTGKTTVATDTIINQKGGDVLCVYVAIGQKNSSIAALVANLEQQGAMDYTVVVSAPAAELPALQYIAPYAGCTLAEYWLSKGKDVLIIYDDLSKHAIAYRTLSLLLRRPPGREAYPGDVFYLHSRLLERACRLNKANGGGSITALPIIETQAGDISAYIPTNVISITDGQIFMMTSLFNSGQRPAIDAGLSVSRVGGAAQIKSVKQMGASMKLELANFRELDAFSQFGSELDKVSKYTLSHGRRILQLLKQAPNHPYKQTDEAIILFAIKEKFIDLIPLDKMIEYRHFFLKNFKEEPYRGLWYDLREKKAFEKERNTLAFRYAFKQITKAFLDQIGYEPDEEEQEAFAKILKPVEEEKKIFDDIRREFLASDHQDFNPDVEPDVQQATRKKLEIPEIPFEELEKRRKAAEAEVNAKNTPDSEKESDLVPHSTTNEELTGTDSKSGTSENPSETQPGEVVENQSNVVNTEERVAETVVETTESQSKPANSSDVETQSAIGTKSPVESDAVQSNISAPTTIEVQDQTNQLSETTVSKSHAVPESQIPTIFVQPEETLPKQSGEPRSRKYVGTWTLKRYQKYVDFGPANFQLGGKPMPTPRSTQIDYNKIAVLNEWIHAPQKLVAPEYELADRLTNPQVAMVNLTIPEFENYLMGKTELFVPNDPKWKDVHTVVVYINDDVQTVLGEWGVHTQLDQTWKPHRAVNTTKMTGNLTKLVIDHFDQYHENGCLQTYQIRDPQFTSHWLIERHG